MDALKSLKTALRRTIVRAAPALPASISGSDWYFRLSGRLPADTLGVVAFHRLPDNQSTCPICGQPGITHAAPYPSTREPFRQWLVYFCTNCGTGHVPNAAHLLEHTFEGGFSDRLVGNRLVPPEDYFSDRGMQENASGFARAASQAKALKKAGARLGRVLDYGSGPGYFLKVAAPETAFAIEPDPDSAKYLDYLGATRLDEDALDEMQFDAIVASHVIEHFTETDVVRRVGRMVAALAPDGRLLIEVPQGGHSRLHLTARDDPHTLFFTAAGLRALVERAGGQVVACFVRSKATHQVREDAIYRPDPNDSFASTLGGGLTVIARPSA